LNPIELIWGQVKGFVVENNTTFRLKDVKELVYGGSGRITKEVWAKAEDHVLKIEKEYGKKNCIVLINSLKLDIEYTIIGYE
jgi:hypothetical protein